MGLFKDNKKLGIIADVIRCDESEYLIWKWRPDGVDSGEHKREYAIRNGSVLRVREGEIAVFVYRQKGGALHDYVVGPFEEKLHTKNLPVIGAVIDSFWGGDTPFQAEVFFINYAKNIQIRFGVPFFDVADSRFPDIGVPVAVRGALNVKIEDYKEFVELYRLEEFKIDEFGAKVREVVNRCVKNVVTNISIAHKVPLIQLERMITFVSTIVENNVDERLKSNFGVKVTGIDISAIELDKSSDGYRQLMAVSRDITTAEIQAKAAAENENYAETLRINREEDAYARRMDTRTKNLGAYKVEEGARVGVAAAAALGEMGSSSASRVDIGGGGFDPVAMSAGIAIGSAVGEGIAGTMKTSMSGSPSAETPPPIPTVAYFVAKDGVQTGPFDMATLSTMVMTGDLRSDTLVWKAGMSAWARADSTVDLAGFFPPPLA